MEAKSGGRGGEATLGEIVEASTTDLRAVATQTFASPAFGSFVRTSDGDRTTYGVVAHVQHATVDPSRRAVPLGRTWEELEREQPQVRELLTTEFQAICFAYAQPDEGINAYLPPVPPRVHDFVHACDPAEIVELTSDLTFVRTLGACGLPVAGELIAAAVRAAAEEHADRHVFLVRAGREVADLYRGDYEQATAILRRFGLRPPERKPKPSRRATR
jgi:hypothetical protein